MDGRRKLILLTHEFAPFRGGVATYCEELAMALTREGTDVVVWAPDYGRRTQNHFPFSVMRLPVGREVRPPHMLPFAWKVFTQREALRGASVILASLEAHRAFLLLRALGVLPCERLVSVLHGSEILRFERNWWWRSLARRFYRGAPRVVTVSEYGRARLRRSFLAGVLKQVGLAPCAAGSAACCCVPVTAHDKIRILTLARLHPRKGQLDVARALARLPEALREQVVYQVAGTGDLTYLRQVQQVCRQAGVVCEPLGEISSGQLATTYAQCDIFAMASRTLPQSVEGFGIVYLEAGVQGKPVVGYRTGGVEEAVRHHETGLLVEEGDVDGLADALKKLIADSELRHRLGEGGRRHAAKFRWDQTAQVILGLNRC